MEIYEQSDKEFRILKNYKEAQLNEIRKYSINQMSQQRNRNH